MKKKTVKTRRTVVKKSLPSAVPSWIPLRPPPLLRMIGWGGWASQNGNTVGGLYGLPVTVTTLAQFEQAVSTDTPLIVVVRGTIDLGSSTIHFKSNKTIIGVGPNSGFIGNLRGYTSQGYKPKNVILANLKFTNPNGAGEGDGLTLKYVTNFVVTHCTFTDCSDGELDMTRASDYGTVSWCKFHYTPQYTSGSAINRNYVNLIGHDDNNAAEDVGHLRITMHHNWYSTLCRAYMPRVRFGKVHLYNNYYSAAGTEYCVGVGNDCRVLLQNCYFDSQALPWKNKSTSGHQGLIHWNSGNVFVNTTIPTWAPNSPVFTPPYSYGLTAGSSVKSVVTAFAGTH